VIAELAGDGLTQLLVLASQFGDEGAGGLELLTERVGGGLLGDGAGADGGLGRRSRSISERTASSR